MKTKLSYTVRSTRAPGELTDTTVPVIVERLQPVDLATVIENCIDRGLIAGLKPTAAQGIAEGVANQIAREFSLGRGVQFGQYFYGRPYLSGVVDSNGRLSSDNKVNVRLYKGNDFKLKIDDYSWEFDGSGDAVKVDHIMADTDDAGGNTWGQIVPEKPVIIEGRNLSAAGDTNKVVFAEVGGSGSPVEVSSFTATGDGLVKFAWPAGLTAGKTYSVVLERTDANGVTRKSTAKKVTVYGTPSPTPTGPTITSVYSNGETDPNVKLNGANLNIRGTGLENGGVVTIKDSNDDDMILAHEASYDPVSQLLQLYVDTEATPAEGPGTVIVVTSEGEATRACNFITE